MADVKICDRCGKKLTEERSTFSVKPITSRCVLSVILFKPKAWYAGDRRANTTHDLCIDCTTKLAEWMEYGETESNTEGNT